MRIRVSDILELFADRVSAETILNDFPDLECEDISAALRGEALIFRALSSARMVNPNMVKAPRGHLFPARKRSKLLKNE